MRVPSFLVAAVAAAVLAAAGQAAPPDLKLKGPDKPAAGQLVTVTADTTGKVVKWKVVGAAAVEDSGGRKVYFAAAGKVTVLAVAASETGELSEFAEWSADLGPPGPGPVDPVVPPLPDPSEAAPAELVAKLQAAYTADAGAEKATSLKAFAEAMDAAVAYSQAGRFATAGDLEKAVRQITKLIVGDGNLTALGGPVGEWLAKSLPADPLAPLPADVRARLGTGYRQVAAALRKVK